MLLMLKCLTVIKALFKTLIIRLKSKKKGADHRVNKGKH